tara:strand:- start:8775 stop:9227 length:453 start_codon:yes stop_codon:yes gene_type:complete
MEDKDKNIACIDFTKFKNYDEYRKWQFKLKDDVYINRQYCNLNVDKDKDGYLSTKKVFDKLARIWVIGKYVVAMQHRGSYRVVLNTDLKRFIIEESYDAVEDPKEVNKYVNEIKLLENKEMSIDSILDKISYEGIDSLTEKEKDFLDNNV